MLPIGHADQPLLLAVVISLMGLVLAASYFDYYHRRIPNILTLGGICWGAILHTVHSGFDGLILAMGGLAVGFVFLFPGYLMGKTGAGDVKLLAAVGAYLGPYSAMIAGFATMLAGAILAMALALFSRGDSPWRRYALICRYLWTTGHWGYIPPEKDEVMAGTYPYAFAIAAGAVAGYWHCWLRGDASPGLG